MSFPITRQGYEKLQAELTALKNNRPAVSAAIGTAREHGDLRENAEYHAAKDQQGLEEARIRDLEAKVSKAQVIDTSNLAKDRVYFGSRVLLVNVDTDEEVTYQIVSEEESDIQGGLISNQAPLARSLISKQVGDTAVVRAPSGEKTYEILEIL